MNDNAIKKMAKFIGEISSTCPLDMFEYEVKSGCDKLCEKEGRNCKDLFYKCWIDYFMDEEGD